jgi:hypothetical protein
MEEEFGERIMVSLLKIEYMVGGSGFTVGFEGDEPWSRPVKESRVR